MAYIALAALTWLAAQGPARPEVPAAAHWAVAAHPDDDLVYMSPSLLHVVRQAEPLTVVYLTAGDAGLDASYWRRRERGIEAAYTVATGNEAPWYRARIAGHDARQLGDPYQIRLIFLRLADGMPSGAGTAAQGNVSLAKLWRGDIGAMFAQDGAAAYTKQGLIAALSNIGYNVKQHAGPVTLHTLNCQGAHTADDHSDHHFAALFAVAAAQKSDAMATYRLYMGNNFFKHGPNVPAPWSMLKWQAFAAYANFDQLICNPPSTNCLANTPYAFTRSRQYVWSMPPEVVSLAGDVCNVAQYNR